MKIGMQHVELTADEAWMVRVAYRMMRRGGMWREEAKRACAALAIGMGRT